MVTGGADAKRCANHESVRCGTFLIACEAGGDAMAGKKTVEVYAHRGVRSFAPENAMPGYVAALAIGTHWVDMDVVMTRDGEIVVSHASS